MAYRNQRGQILVESVFLFMLITSLLIGFQIMIDHQKTESGKYRLSKYRKDIVYDKKNNSQSNAKE